MVDQEIVLVQPTRREAATMTRCMKESVGPAIISSVVTYGLAKRLINNLDTTKPFVDRLKHRAGLACLPPAFSMAYFVATLYNNKVCKPRILSLPGPRSEFQTALGRQSNGENINVTFLPPADQISATQSSATSWSMIKPDKIISEPSQEEKNTLTRCWAAASIPAIALYYVSYRLVDMGRQAVNEYIERVEVKSSFKTILKRAPKAHILPALSAVVVAYFALTEYNERVCKPKLLSLPPSEYQSEFKRSLPENDRSEEVREAVALQFGTWEVQENIVEEVNNQENELNSGPSTVVEEDL